MPGALEARVKEAAEADGVAVNAFIVTAIEEKLQRRGSTTPVAPPERTRKPAAVRFAAAEDEQPEPAPKNCKHRNMRGVKGVCPDCQEWVTK